MKLPPEPCEWTLKGHYWAAACSFFASDISLAPIVVKAFTFCPHCSRKIRIHDETMGDPRAGPDQHR